MKRIIYTLLLLLSTMARAQDVHEFTETKLNQSDGLSENTVSRIIQDHMGFMWIATWNGLNRYDGKNFRCFKAEPGKDCPLPGNRIDCIVESDEGDIWCLSGECPFLFRRKTQRFERVLGGIITQPISSIEKRQKGITCFVSHTGELYFVKDAHPERLLKKAHAVPGSDWLVRISATTDRYEFRYYNKRLSFRDLRTDVRGAVVMPPSVTTVFWLARYGMHTILASTDRGLFFYSSPSQYRAVPGWETKPVKNTCVDSQGNIWMCVYPGITVLHPQRRITRPQKATAGIGEESVRALYQDKARRVWIADKNGMVRIIANGKTAYLSADGSRRLSPCNFGRNVYCIFEDSRGIFWLGTKTDGLLKLSPTSGGNFSITCFDRQTSGLNCQAVYAVAEDDRHNLWLATFGGGINKLVRDAVGHERIFCKDNAFVGYPKEALKARCLYYAGKGVMMAGTMGGLLTFSTRDARPAFHLNTRSSHPLSLPNNDVLQIKPDKRGGIWLATLGGGISRLQSGDWLSSHIKFGNVTVADGLASDVCLTLSPDNKGNLWIVSEMALTKYDPVLHKAFNFSIKDFGSGFVFTEVCPLITPRAMLFGTTSGTLTIPQGELKKSAFVPEVALTSISVEGKEREGDYNGGNTLQLGKDERNVVVEFSTLDYNLTTPIRYKYKVEGLDNHWQVSDSPTLSLVNLPPGKYVLKVVSTNGDGIWNSKVRSLSIVVEPKFGETIWAKLLYSLLMVLLGIMVICVVRYIYGLRAQIEDIQLAANEKIEKVTSRIQEIMGKKPTLEELDTTLPEELLSQQKLFTDRLMAYMNDNIGNAELQVADIAQHMGMSKTLFYSKMKEILNCTPLNFINDLRIKRAMQLLGKTDHNVSSVAYACGFSDPHYFSRCFKKVTGCSPSEYVKRNAGKV